MKNEKAPGESSVEAICDSLPSKRARVEGHMNGVTAHADALPGKASASCPVCGEDNAIDATFCRSCAHELSAAATDEISKEQRIKNFSAWHQAVVSASVPVATTQPQRLRWPYWIAGAGIAVVCFALVAYVL